MRKSIGCKHDTHEEKSILFVDFRLLMSLFVALCEQKIEILVNCKGCRTHEEKRTNNWDPDGSCDAANADVPVAEHQTPRKYVGVDHGGVLTDEGVARLFLVWSSGKDLQIDH
jgi:hypothetical protein